MTQRIRIWKSDGSQQTIVLDNPLNLVEILSREDAVAYQAFEEKETGSGTFVQVNVGPVIVFGTKMTMNEFEHKYAAVAKDRYVQVYTNAGRFSDVIVVVRSDQKVICITPFGYPYRPWDYNSDDWDEEDFEGVEILFV